MGTSRSSRHEKWIAGVHIYSGRPDPTWEVKRTAAQKMIRYWNSLKARAGVLPSRPGLGYRGCFLRGRGREWIIYHDAVMLKKAGGWEIRLDREQQFEKALLASAPARLLPPSLGVGH